MHRFQFTDEKRNVIAKERFYHPNPRIHWRMEVLWFKQHGETCRRITELAGASRRSVQQCSDVFAEGGLEAVRQFHVKGRVNGLALHLQSPGACPRIRKPAIPWFFSGSFCF